MGTPAAVSAVRALGAHGAAVRGWIMGTPAAVSARIGRREWRGSGVVEDGAFKDSRR